jgi:(1->4)-alpha-D-glucan 1-alpha-D-glucosylmutase
MVTLDELLNKTYERIASRRRVPVSTYRLQFHAGFTFRDATAIVPYLHDLGITHCYASPYLKARPGSQHGYDIIDHRLLNPEIGSEDDYEAWVKALHAHNMGQILDMVPNHMGIVGNENVWWNDVLENGPSSPYAGYFDIAWQDASRPELLNRALLPVLGDPYGQVLEAGQIRLAYDSGSFTIHYFNHRFPVAPHSYALILSQDLVGLEGRLAADSAHLNEYKSILTALSHLPDHNETDAQKIAERLREKEIIKRRLGSLVRECPEVCESLETTTARFNGTKRDPHSFDRLDELLNEQAYRLAYWRVAADEINYRRFFDINELAAISMEKLEVFTAAHQLVLRYLGQGDIDGLRIDHPDGLFDPRQYLERLQHYYLLACARSVFESEAHSSETQWKDVEGALLEKIADTASQASRELPLYVVVEKILSGNENLPADWLTSGTSGYDFINALNGLFVDPLAEKGFTLLYEHQTGDYVPYGEVVYWKKYQVLRDALSSEHHMLGRQLDRLAQKNRGSRDFTRYSLRFALGQVIACFPVYRSYISDENVHDSDRKYVENAVVRAMRRNSTVSRSLFRFIRDMLLLRYSESATECERAEQRRFTGKFQQVTGPVMAKGVEDTAFYVYNRMLSLNEVGGNPAQFGVKPDAVHRFNQARQARWPYALSPLSTHDTKRSEDIRARLNVLSEFPAEWAEAVSRWTRLNEPHRSREYDEPVPDDNEEYLIYQTLVGAWPLEPYTPAEYAQFVERIQDYVTKALHEAKVHTSWINPDDDYDKAVREFIAHLLDEQESGEFLRDLREFRVQISHFGLLNSLAQTLLRITSPGTPDTYQGTELWDFSLVDPDNRRPVDYRRRAEMLRALDARLAKGEAERRSLARELIRFKDDSRVKLFVTSQALRLRRDQPNLFSTGDYLPAEVVGNQQEHIFGFTRRSGNDVAIILVPRLVARLRGPDGLPLGRTVWQDTRVLLPEHISALHWRNIFTGQAVTAKSEQGRGILAPDEVFADFPLALLTTLEEGSHESRR